MENIDKYLLTLLPVLVTAWIGIRIFEVRAKRGEAKAEYEKFKSAIWPFLHSILSEEGNLNAELLQHFPTHKNAAREYINNLNGRKKKKFIEIWHKYETEYQQIKSLGPFAVAVAIAPNEADLPKGPNSAEMIQWEVDRINNINKLLNELLQVAQKKIWF
ncbi:MAG: hypothetical protein HWD86_00020 [Kangiellaceae bacterium]|nr:hypothetical protein [Kangiellaceae bacterium]